MTTPGLGIFTLSSLSRINFPKRNSRYFRTFGRQRQRKRKVRDSSLIKYGKPSASGQPSISSITRLILDSQHLQLTLWPVLTAGPYNRRKSYPAFYTAAPAA